MKHSNRKTPFLVIMSLLMILVLVFAFTGCGPKETASDNNNDQSDNGSTQDPEITPDPEPEKEISESELVALIQEGRQLTEYAYTVTMNSEYGTTSSQIWIKGDKVKIESMQDGVPFIMLNDKNVSYALDVNNKTALKMTMDEDDMGFEEDPVSFDEVPEMDEESLSLMGRESINGEPCYIVESTDEESNSKVKMWIHEEYGLAMRVEFTGENPSENVITEISDLKVGNIPNDVFVVPPDYEVIEWSNMMDMPENWMGTDED